MFLRTTDLDVARLSHNAVVMKACIFSDSDFASFAKPNAIEKTVKTIEMADHLELNQMQLLTHP